VGDRAVFDLNSPGIFWGDFPFWPESGYWKAFIFLALFPLVKGARGILNVMHSAKVGMRLLRERIPLTPFTRGNTPLLFATRLLHSKLTGLWTQHQPIKESAQIIGPFEPVLQIA
jgi:hypothetical protein